MSMPQETFTQYPVVQDGYLDGNNQVQGNPTNINKDWWENQLYAWIISMVQGTSYPYMTPGEMIDKMASGNYSAPLSITSTSEYTNNATADNTTVYVAGSLFTLSFPEDIYEVFEGGYLRFDDVGNFPITFTLDDAYMRINIGVDYTDDIVQLVITQSTESVTVEGLSDPGNYSANWKYCGYVILQNVAGEIQAITEGEITSFGYQVWSSLDSGLIWKGLWDALNNVPDISATTPVKGDYYIVSTEGTTDLNGIAVWDPGDYAIYDGTTWTKLKPEHNPYGLTYRGIWDADENIPDIANEDRELNDFWVVHVNGETDIEGITEWYVGDYALWDATGWNRVPETDFTMKFQGTWNAALNEPDFNTFTPDHGDYWTVSTPGNTEVNSIAEWDAGNYLLWSGGEWTRVEVTGGGGSGGVGIGTGASSLQYVGPSTNNFILTDFGLPMAYAPSYKSVYFHKITSLSGVWQSSDIQDVLVQAYVYDRGYGNTHLYFKTNNSNVGRLTLYVNEGLDEWVLTPKVVVKSEGSQYNYTDGTSTLYIPANATSPGDAVVDLGGNTYTITNTNVTRNTAEYQVGTSSLLFTGTEYLEISDPANALNFGTNDYTISFHIKAATDASDHIIMSNHYSNDTGWKLVLNSSGNLSFHGVNRTTIGWTSWESAAIGDDTWHHVILCYSATEQKIRVWRDGVFMAQLNNVLETAYNVGTFTIGAPTSGESGHVNFSGLLSDIIIQNGTAHFIVNQSIVPHTYSEKELEDGRGENLNTYSYITDPDSGNNALFMVSSDNWAAPYINSLIFTHTNLSTLQYVAQSTPIDPNGDYIIGDASALAYREYKNAKYVLKEITYHDVDAHMASTTLHYPQESIDHTIIQNTGSVSHEQLDVHTEATMPSITNSAAPIELGTSLTPSTYYGSKTHTFSGDIQANIEDWRDSENKIIDVSFQLVNNDDKSIEMTYLDERDHVQTQTLALPPINTLGYATTQITNDVLDIPMMSYRGNALYIPGGVNDANLAVHIPRYAYQNGNGGSIPYSNTQAHLGTYSLSFNGSDYLEITNRYSDFFTNDNRPMSIAFWIYTTDTNEIYPISTDEWYIAIDNGALIFYGVDAGSWSTGITGINDGAWHYVSITKDATHLYAWLDGAGQQSTTYTSIAHDAFSAVYIGDAMIGYMEDIILTRELLWTTSTFDVPTVPLEETRTSWDVRAADFYIYSNYDWSGNVVTPYFYNLASTHSNPTVVGTVYHTTSGIHFTDRNSYIKYPYETSYHLSDDKPWTLAFRFKPEKDSEYFGVWGIMDDDWEGLCVTYEYDSNHGILSLEGYKTDEDDWEWGQIDPWNHGDTSINLNDGEYHSILITYYPDEDAIVAWFDGKHRTQIEHTVTGFTNTTTGFYVGSIGDESWTDGHYEGYIQELMFMNHTTIVDYDTVEFKDELLWYQNSEVYHSALYISPETTENYLLDKSIYAHDLAYTGVTVNSTETVLGRASLEFDGSSRIDVNDSGDIAYLYGGYFSIAFRIKTASDTGDFLLFSGGSSDLARTWTLTIQDGAIGFGTYPGSISQLYAGNIADDAWHRVIITDYGTPGTVHCYIDGVDTGLTGSNGIAISSSSGSITIGDSDSTAYTAFTGFLADVCFMRLGALDATQETLLDNDVLLSSGMKLNANFSNYDFIIASSQTLSLQGMHLMLRNRLNGAIASWPLIELGGGAEIDDAIIASDTVWSSDKVATEFAQIAPELAITDTSNTIVNVDYITFDNSSFEVQDLGDGEAQVNYIGAGGGGSGLSRLTWKVNGAVGVAANIDMSRRLAGTGTLTTLVVMLENTGTGGAPLVLDLKKNGGSITSTPPTIPPASGVFQSILFNTFDNTSVVGSDYFTVDTVSVPTNAQNLVIELIIA